MHGPNLTEQEHSAAAELEEILEGLSRSHKALSPKFFYDSRGSTLFDAICELPEYYLTRTELSIMQMHIDEIAGLVGPQASLIEFGSGSSLKIRMLLEKLDQGVIIDQHRRPFAASEPRLDLEYPPCIQRCQEHGQDKENN